MFITKRAFNKAIDEATKNAEERAWRHWDEERKQIYEGERFEKLNERLRKVEECCGLVKSIKVCPCELPTHPNF